MRRLVIPLENRGGPMLTLVATCYLAGQIIFAVPADWRVIEVYSGGMQAFKVGRTTLTYCDLACEEQAKRAFVKLTRSVKPGDIVETPADCTLTITTTKD